MQVSRSTYVFPGNKIFQLFSIEQIQSLHPYFLHVLTSDFFLPYIFLCSIPVFENTLIKSNGYSFSLLNHMLFYLCTNYILVKKSHNFFALPVIQYTCIKVILGAPNLHKILRKFWPSIAPFLNLFSSAFCPDRQIQ